MKWASEALYRILPSAIHKEVQTYGAFISEIRVRVHHKVQYVLQTDIQIGQTIIKPEDVQFIINTASRYSPWSSATVSDGYITAPGGHRIGIAGLAAVKDGVMHTIRQPMSLCIRVAKDYHGISGSILNSVGNILLLGPPGSGKTTLLRDLVRSYSDFERGNICVIDEREELFPIWNNQYAFDTGKCTDVLTGCPKSQGIMLALRTMGPSCIAVDEITDEKDCHALEQAGWCGVRMFATAHASSMTDLLSRPIYRSIWEKKLFDNAVILSMDKSYTLERIL